MSEWRDIKTAPKDGTEILLWTPDGKPHIIVASWQIFDVFGDDNKIIGQEGSWDYSEELIADVAGGGPENVTHWMPLPEPPNA